MILKIQYRLALLLLVIPFLTFANTDLIVAKTSKERNIKKSFNVSSDATLKVTNSFGNLNIITWDENRIEFNITIKISGNDEEKVQDRLNGIDVEFSSSNDLVSAITKIEKNKKNWWNWGKKMNLKMEIDYVIKMPMTNNVDLNNKFGSINLDRLKGSSKIRCDHGKITTKELMSNNNVINFNHTRNSYFEYIKEGKISANHSGFTITKAEKINLSANHTRSIVEFAENIDYNCNHGSLKVDNINNLDGKGNHLTTRIGNVFKNLKLRGSHVSLKIERLASKANSIDIDTRFTSMTIGYDAGFNFNFDFDFSHGSLRDSQGFNFTNKHTDYTSKAYEGYYGSQDSGNMVKIKSQHGSVSFKRQ
ncbi:hypothetical protein [Winogradskyella sp. PG-2]|uniref:hypothetical protein n=1 Tax=Winogradskyella sp. PG-2 TaxID=754409 RepID=UPI00045875A3|nr:hypothetical protein [Winogradskyella sp. PG-2]BAO77131.1 hypothetical protein WPG_2901 [Winogradskyella sp. PG-2]